MVRRTRRTPCYVIHVYYAVSTIALQRAGPNLVPAFTKMEKLRSPAMANLQCKSILQDKRSKAAVAAEGRREGKHSDTVGSSWSVPHWLNRGGSEACHDHHLKGQLTELALASHLCMLQAATKASQWRCFLIRPTKALSMPTSDAGIWHSGA